MMNDIVNVKLSGDDKYWTIFNGIEKKSINVRCDKGLEDNEKKKENEMRDGSYEAHSLFLHVPSFDYTC